MVGGNQLSAAKMGGILCPHSSTSRVAGGISNSRDATTRPLPRSYLSPVLSKEERGNKVATRKGDATKNPNPIAASFFDNL